MVLLKLLFITLTFHEFIVDLDAILCPKGQRVINRNRCETCPDNYYQPEITDSRHCRPCTKCDGQRGSDVKVKCTKETNTVCQCRGGFVPLERDSATCKCNPGFGKRNGECLKCDDGYFSNGPDPVCRKWKECKSGVKITGNKTSDVTCNPETGTSVSVTPTRIGSLIERLTPPQHEKAKSQTVHSTTNTITTSTTTTRPSTTTTTRTTRAARTPNPGDKDNYSSPGVTLVILGIIVLLLLLTAMACKLHITAKPIVPKTDSCRRPVEESGDGSLSPLKPGEN